MSHERKRQASGARANAYVDRGLRTERAGNFSSAAVWFRKASVEWARTGNKQRAHLWASRAKDVRSGRFEMGSTYNLGSGAGARALARKRKGRVTKSRYKRDPSAGGFRIEHNRYGSSFPYEVHHGHLLIGSFASRAAASKALVRMRWELAKAKRRGKAGGRDPGRLRKSKTRRKSRKKLPSRRRR